MKLKKFRFIIKLFLLGLFVFLASTTGTYLLLNKYQITIPPRALTNLAPGAFLKNLKEINFPRAYIVESGSMEPAIKTGSVVFTQEKDAYFKGDIITFNPEGKSQPVTHRIEAVFYSDGVRNQPTYKTSGDANEDLDNWEVGKDDVIGKVSFTIPYMGYAASFAQTPQGFILLVIVPATIVVYEELRTLFFESRKVGKSIFKRVSKKKETTNTLNNEGSRISKAAILLPLFGGVVLFIGLTGSFLSDTERAIGNILSAVDNSGGTPGDGEEPTGSPTPEPSPSPAPNGTTINLSNMESDPQYGYIHNYASANVSFTYQTPSSERLGGTINASGLKPYYTYQVKFEGIPTCIDPSGNDSANEHIGYHGRWTCVSANCAGQSASDRNRSDAEYEANKLLDNSNPDKECLVGYLVWDFFTTDTSGNANKVIETANSYHVLWCGGGTCNTNNNDQLVTGLDPGQPSLKLCQETDVDGQIERFSCGGMTLDPGIYHLKMILTEESFHQGPGTWTAVMDALIDFEILPDHLVINEVLANPYTTFSDEWVEIYNPTSSAVNLSGWSLKDLALSARDLTYLGTIGPYEFKVHTDSGDGWLNNGSETLKLLDPSLNEIDLYSHTSAGNDTSRGRDPDGTEGFATCTLATQGTSNNGNCP